MRDSVVTGMWLILIGTIIGALVVVAVDPGCGPDGDSQRACAAELAEDLGGGR